jgi:hypothetical protein
MRALLAEAGFDLETTWSDRQRWFACIWLGRDIGAGQKVGPDLGI